MNPDSPDLRPDPRLRAALRHAPDADLQAPAELGARIRAAARAAVEGDRPPHWWRRLWPSTPLRLGTSGAFASLLLAGVIGLLWRGEPPPAAVDPRPLAIEPATPAPAPAPAPAPVAAPQTPPSATPLPRALPAPRAEPPAARAMAPAAATPQPPQPPQQERSEARVAESAGELTASAAPAAAPPPPAMERVEAAKTAAPAPAAITTAAPVAPAITADRARRLAAPAPSTAQADNTAGAAPAPMAADAWRREWDRIVGDRWRALDGVPSIALRRVGEADVGVAETRAVLCEGRPRRCREAELTAAEAKRLVAVLPP